MSDKKMKLTDNIHQLQIDFEIILAPDRKIPRFVNILVIFGENITLIDTGVRDSEVKIFDYIRQNGRDISEIKTVILSHSHPDHIGSAARIKELTGCRIMAHQAEKEWIENIDIQNNERPVPGFFNLVDRSVQIDDYLEDKQEILLGENLTAKIIHSPGHSKGLLNILFREDKILFTSDSIPLKNDIPNYDNYIDLNKSLDFIKSNREYEIILSSWTSPLLNMEDSHKIIAEGEEYIKRIDKAVKEHYTNTKDNFTDCCKKTVETLELPPFLVNPVVNRAFMSHLKETREILIIKNITREDTGLLGDIIRENGIKHKIIDLSKGEPIGLVENYGAVIVLGGPDSANDETAKMKSELAFIRKLLAKGIPYLGICLGLQTMVRAAGGQVVKSSVNEIGFRDQESKQYNVQLTDAGRADPLFEGIDSAFNVFQLHGETVILTEKMELLAEGRWCRNQVLKAGRNAYGIQCHFELTMELLENWIKEDPDLQKLDNEQLKADFRSISRAYSDTGRKIFQNFIRIAGFI
jgi:GMP synthase-like glutamine amidotransferase/glyoxylase-like metal-dependent hydrolase (beta-lactamase superfamily II)